MKYINVHYINENDTFKLVFKTKDNCFEIFFLTPQLLRTPKPSCLTSCFGPLVNTRCANIARVAARFKTTILTCDQ